MVPQREGLEVLSLLKPHRLRLVVVASRPSLVDVVEERHRRMLRLVRLDAVGVGTMVVVVVRWIMVDGLVVIQMDVADGTGVDQVDVEVEVNEDLVAAGRGSDERICNFSVLFTGVLGSILSEFGTILSILWR